jgi:hypothetical protein
MSVGEERRRSSGDDNANFVAVRQPLGAFRYASAEAQDGFKLVAEH